MQTVCNTKVLYFGITGEVRRVCSVLHRDVKQLFSKVSEVAERTGPIFTASLSSENFKIQLVFYSFHTSRLSKQCRTHAHPDVYIYTHTYIYIFIHTCTQKRSHTFLVNWLALKMAFLIK